MRIILATILLFPLYSALANEHVKNNPTTWHNIQLQVASITDLSSIFSRSIRIFAQGEGVYSGMDYEFVEGDASTDIKDTETIHILGNLSANIYLDDHSELIVSGNVNEKAKIFVNGMSRIYIGGNLYGSIISTDSLDITIKGNHEGIILTGAPSTKLTVYGDFIGELKPSNPKDGSLVSINVYGFTDIKIINKIYKHPYTEIDSAFHVSNKKPGIYNPKRPYRSYYVILNERK